MHMNNFKRPMENKRGASSLKVPVTLLACMGIGYSLHGLYFEQPKNSNPAAETQVVEQLGDAQSETVELLEINESAQIQQQREALAQWMPKEGFETLGKQKKHQLGGMKTTREEKAAYPFNLGPIGILASRDPKAMRYTVTEVDDSSPAAGKIESGDVIYGVAGKPFTEIDGPEAAKARFPNPQMGMAIENAESTESALLSLMIERGGAKSTVDIQLKPLGAFGEGFPHSSAKAEFLADLEARTLVAQQNSDGSWGSGFADDKKKNGKLLSTCMGGLALLSTGEDKYDEKLKLTYEWVLGQYPKSFQTWQFCYRAAFLAEYYFRFGDDRAKPEIKKMVDELAGGAFYYNGIYGYGHSLIRGNYRYGGINACTAHAALTFGIAKTLGIEVPDGMDLAMARSLERLAPDGALGYAWTGRSKGEITTVKHNEDSGRSGVGYMAYRLLGGRKEHQKKMLDYLLLNKEYTDCGHSSGGSMSWVWASIGMGFDSEKEYTELMQSRIWYFNFNRRHDAGFYLQPSAHLQFRPSDVVLGAHYTNAGNVILLNWHKHNMLLTGKDEYKTKNQSAYQDELIASSDYFERQDRVVEVAEAGSLLQNKTPASVKALMEALKRVAIESPHYQSELDVVYGKYLDKAVRDVANTSLPTDTRRDAIAALLGINYNCQMSLKGKNARVSHRITPANAGDLTFTSKIEKAKGTFEKQLEPSTTRNAQRFNQTIKLKDEDPTIKLKGKTVIRWNDIQMDYPFTLEQSEGVRGKWSRNPSDTVYGPFPAVVEKAKENGAFQVRMAGDILFECSLMGNTEVLEKGQKPTTYVAWRKKNKQDFPAGTKLTFSYFNRGGNILTPMCDSVQIQ